MRNTKKSVDKTGITCYTWSNQEQIMVLSKKTVLAHLIDALRYNRKVYLINMEISEENVLNDIREMLSDAYPTIKITMDTYLEFGDKSYLDMASIEIAQFIVDLEEKFDIIIDIEDRYYTIGDAVRAVVSYLREKEENISEESTWT